MEAIFKLSGIWVALVQSMALYVSFNVVGTIISRRPLSDFREGVIFFFLLIPILTFYTWLFLTALVASPTLIEPESKKDWNLKGSYIVLVGDVLSFPLLWNLSKQHDGAFEVQIALHVVASICGLYIFVRASKSIKRLELNRHPRLGESGKLMGLIFLSWMFPPLIWYVHNRFRRAISGGSIPEHAKNFTS